MPLALELNCLVLGDDSSHIFTIEIQGTKNISALRKAIKEEKKPIFDHVPADALKLFKDSLSVDDYLDAKLTRFRPEDKGDRRRLSSAVERLRNVFGDAPDKHLHVVVLPPAAVPAPSSPSVHIFELNCFVQGDDASQVFSVEIANNKPISALRKAIKEEKQPQLDHVTADSLTLWNVSIPVDDGLKENVSNVIRVQEALSPAVQLSDVFTDVLIQKHVHIIVKSPRIGNRNVA